KSTGFSSRALCRSFVGSVFLSRAPILLERQAGAGATSAGGGKADDTCHVRAEHALTGGANRDWRAGDRIADRRRITVARPSEFIAALRAARQNLVQQASIRRESRAGCR